MEKLIVTADLHGSYSAWLFVKQLLKPRDQLVIAGDLFDTRYGSCSNQDFQPDSIKNDLGTLTNDFYYVYGNCDIPAFFPGFDTALVFNALNKNIFLVHGHSSFCPPENINIIIQGHTHVGLLEKRDQQIFMNPGSITNPRRNSLSTYAVIDNTSVRLIEIKTGNTLSTILF